MKRKKGKKHVQPLTRSIGILQNGTLRSAQLREVLDGNETADNFENGRGTIPPPFQRYLIPIYRLRNPCKTDCFCHSLFRMSDISIG